ncbi:MAG: hypothetical protein M0Q25_08590 [Sulfurospirillaceae bacterium]|nr:hypothetical protein [Sulfurospirillaceae bacterium]MDY0237596.1 hypothetical protein [Campylobacterales bacterium]
MLKKSLVLSGALVFATAGLANDIESYLGIGGGVDWSRFKENVTYTAPGIYKSSSITETKSAFSMKLTGGAIVDQNHRLSLSYIPVFKSYYNIHNFLGAYDYLYSLDGDKKIYGGIHLGFANFKGKKDASVYGDKTAFAYGLQGGLIYELDRNLELDFGLMYTKHDAKLKYQETVGAGVYNSTAKLEHSLSALVGINYKF